MIGFKPHPKYKAPAILYLSISNNIITGIIEKHREEVTRFEYNLTIKKQSVCILDFMWYFGKYAPFNIAGKNNKRLRDQMFSFFRRDKEMFDYFFNPTNEKLNINYPEIFDGFTQCEFIRDKLTKKTNIYFLDSVLEFGKYKGKTIRDIMSFDQQYVRYLIRSGKNFSNSVLNIFN